MFFADQLVTVDQLLKIVAKYDSSRPKPGEKFKIAGYKQKVPVHIIGHF